MEVELGNEESIQLERDGDGGVELTDTLEKLMISPRPDLEKSNLVLELEAARKNWIAGKRRAARVAWREKSVKEVRERSQFQEKMVKMLPEERMALLKEVKDPEEKRKKADMSMLWRELTKKDQTRYLFQKVLRILHGNGHLPKNDLLGCRLACQEWRNSVDLYFQNLVDYPKEGEGPRIRLNLYSEFLVVSQFREWSARTYAVGENPFLARKLFVGSPALPLSGGFRRLNGLFWGQVEELLQLWGGELWDVFFWFDGGLNYATLYLNLQRFLWLMPNSRYVCLICQDFPESRMCRLIPDPSDDNDRLFKTETAMNKRMAEIHLPEMAHVKVLDLHQVPPSTVNGMLVKYGSTLETLRVDAASNNPNEYGAGMTLPRLKKFVMSATVFEGVPPGSPKIDWPVLEDLAMKYSDLEADQIPEIFIIANGFGSTLLNLTLALHKEESVGKLDEKQLKKLRLDLPRVEKFSLSVSRLNLKGIDFILSMAALKELSVTYVKFVSNFEKKKAKKAEPGMGSSSSSADNPGKLSSLATTVTACTSPTFGASSRI